MGAADLLAHLQGAGFALSVTDNRVVIRPASMLTDNIRAEVRQAKPELLALLGNQRDTETIELAPPIEPVTLNAEVLDIPPLGSADWLPAGMEARHYEAATWTDADIARFIKRRDSLLCWGWAEAAAESLAERLVKRDRAQDKRVNCTECANYRPGKCGNYRRAGLLQPAVGRDMAGLLQHCTGFESGETLQ